MREHRIIQVIMVCTLDISTKRLSLLSHLILILDVVRKFHMHTHTQTNPWHFLDNEHYVGTKRPGHKEKLQDCKRLGQ